LCRQDWVKTHEGEGEKEFKAYWNGLSEEGIKRKKAHKERKRVKASYGLHTVTDL